MPAWGRSAFIVEEPAVGQHKRQEHALLSGSRERPVCVCPLATSVMTYRFGCRPNRIISGVHLWLSFWRPEQKWPFLQN